MILGFNDQAKTMVTQAVTTAHKEVLSEALKVMDSRKIVPFKALADKWSSILKYWAAKGNTEIEIKSKTASNKHIPSNQNDRNSYSNMYCTFQKR